MTATKTEKLELMVVFTLRWQRRNTDIARWKVYINCKVLDIIFVIIMHRCTIVIAISAAFIMVAI